MKEPKKSLDIYILCLELQFTLVCGHEILETIISTPSTAKLTGM